jgi:hypothetical protein
MKTRASRLVLMIAAMGALGACGSNDTLPPAVAAPGAATVTPPPAVAVAPGVTTGPLIAGSLVGPPGTYVVVPSSDGSTAVVPSRLSSTDIAAVVSGNTASGMTADGQPYYTKFRRDGSLTFREGSNYVANGNWRVTTDGELCSRLANVNFGTEQCYTLYRSGSGYVYERPDGHPVGNFVISPGA